MPKQLNLPKLEEEVQKYWDEKNIFRRVCEQRRGGKKFYFCQGPPFTTGQAHIGHAWNHAIKDLILRYKTMQGFDVFRRAGWDMHGLPIEVKVEEEVLKSRSKKDIEEFGVDNFIAECKKFAIRNMNAMAGQIKRLGVWLDWDDPYQTIDCRYMESVWYGIKKAHEKGLLYCDKKVIHWCPRCETAMAGYEVKDEYRDVTDDSVYVKAKISGGEYILIWTTTPWTLPSNAAIAVHPDFDYVRARYNGETLILAKERLGVLDGDCEVIETFKGKKLEGVKYEAILDIPLQKEIKRKIVMAPELVTLEEGVGCVHIAPGHGQEDAIVGKKYDLQKPSPVDESGKFDIEPYKGIYIRDANQMVIRHLDEAGRLLKKEKITHRYPHCWRCKTPLLLRSTKQWFIAVSKIKDELIANNKKIQWVPESIGSGRFENWLSQAEDWCISRQRYWNTPLPVWCCGCGEIRVIGSIRELAAESAETIDKDKIDLHMPEIDKVKLKCKCNGEMSRVRDVIDVWLDSGSASWANLGYPASEEKIGMFPADFITEGSDQTRGWFYSMLVCGTIAMDAVAYKKVLYHGFTLDADGKKMSKSIGNVVDPIEIAEKYGADSLRFYMLMAVPWDDLRFSMEGLESVNRTINILWNTLSFAKTYMELDGFDPKKEYKLRFETEDLWIISRFNSLVKNTTASFESAHPHEITRQISDFIIEFSRWYVKLVRDRVWIPGDDPRKFSVHYTMNYVLSGLAKLMAPVTPHLSEHVFRELAGEESVHFCAWPAAEEGRIDDGLERRMATAQKIIECAAAARQSADIKLRWPIKRVVVAPKTALDMKGTEDIILKLCNAKNLETKDIKMDVIVKPNFQSIGPKFKKDMGKIAALLAKSDAAKLLKDMGKNKKIKLVDFELAEGDLLFETKMPQGLVAEEFDEGVVYIDEKLDEELYSEAMSREVIRRIQEMRKDMKLKELEIVDVSVSCKKDFEKYVTENKESIEGETRSKIRHGKAKGFSRKWEIEGNTVDITIKN